MIGMFLIGYLTERKYYNKGICPKCGENLELVARDSQGGRGYKCPKCEYITWVSYSLVDELYYVDMDGIVQKKEDEVVKTLK
jgi:tRNA(Ile2) C34 agmatinyltransferase TiaS